MEASIQHEPRWAGVREVLGMALPIVIGTMSYALMQFVDNKFVAAYSQEALAAIGSAAVWSFTLSAFFIGTVACVSTFVSQSVGRGKPHDSGAYAWQGLYISLATGAFALLLYPFSSWFFGLFNHEPEVTRLEVVYFDVRLLGYAFIAAQAALAAFFQAIGRPIIPTVVALVAVLLNVVLDYVLIFGYYGFPEWGIGGAALATVISLLFQAGLLVAIMLEPGLSARYGTRENWRPDRKRMGELIRIGSPSGLYMIMDVTVWSVFISLIIGRFGQTALAANGVAITYMHLGFMPALGLHHGITPIVGKWIGRGNIAMAKARTYTAIRLAVGYMVTAGLLLAFFGEPLMRFFSADPDVIALGRTFLIFTAIFMGFDAVGIVASGALRGVGDTRFLAIMTFIGAYVIFLPIATVLAIPMELGAAGAWMGATFYIILVSAVMFHRFHGEAWRNIKIFADEVHVPDELPIPDAVEETVS